MMQTNSHPNEKKSVSVVILNWNGAAMLRRFLGDVVRYSPEAEVVVADNGSTDDSLSLLAREYPTVRVLAFDRNYGFAEGYNRALAQITTTYTLLLNDDVAVTPHWLQPLLDHMARHPEVAACQPKLRSERDHSRFEYAGACGGYLDRLGYPYCRGRVMDTVERDEGQYDTVASVLWATGAALLVRTALYNAVGGLDPLFFAHQEEIDLCWRLRTRGYLITCVPESVVYHVGGATLPQGNPRKTFLNFRNNQLLLYKNLSPRRLVPVLAARMVLDWMAALQALLSGRKGDAAAIIKARLAFWRLRPQMKAARRDNLRQTVAHRLPELRPGSLLWHYYVLRHHTFNQLQGKS